MKPPLCEMIASAGSRSLATFGTTAALAKKAVNPST